EVARLALGSERQHVATLLRRHDRECPVVGLVERRRQLLLEERPLGHRQRHRVCTRVGVRASEIRFVVLDLVLVLFLFGKRSGGHGEQHRENGKLRHRDPFLWSRRRSAARMLQGFLQVTNGATLRQYPAGVARRPRPVAAACSGIRAPVPAAPVPTAVPSSSARSSGACRSPRGTLLGVAVILGVLWLIQIVPALATRTDPAGLEEVGLAANPVHILTFRYCCRRWSSSVSSSFDAACSARCSRLSC